LEGSFFSVTDSNKVSSLECLFYCANAASASGSQNQKTFSVMLGFRHIKTSFVFSLKMLYLVEGTQGLEHKIHPVSYKFLLDQSFRVLERRHKMKWEAICNQVLI
jgi:hypothetical protein